MGEYKILFKKSVEKDFQSIPKKDLQRILSRIKILARNPRPPGCEKLAGHDIYRLRQGLYRILYSFGDGELTVLIIRVAHRNDVYRKK